MPPDDAISSSCLSSFSFPCSGKVDEETASSCSLPFSVQCGTNPGSVVMSA